MKRRDGKSCYGSSQVVKKTDKGARIANYLVATLSLLWQKNASTNSGWMV